MAAAFQPRTRRACAHCVHRHRTGCAACREYSRSHRLRRNQLTLVYRVLRKAHAKSPFDGEGAYRYGGRWSSAGTRLSYASEHESLAMLEYFVHLDAGDPPPDLVLAAANISDEIDRETIDQKKLPRHWREAPAPPELASF